MLQDVIRQVVEDNAALELIGEPAAVEGLPAAWERVEADVVVRSLSVDMASADGVSGLAEQLELKVTKPLSAEAAPTTRRRGPRLTRARRRTLSASSTTLVHCWHSWPSFRRHKGDAHCRQSSPMSVRPNVHIRELRKCVRNGN